MVTSSSPRPFRVLIAGGGISGLTLANCLELAEIDYVLLEARDDLTPFVGAGLCLNAGSAPLLEQLGIRDQLFEKIAPLQYIGSHYPNGDYAAAPSAGVLLNDSRCGYTRGFIERGEILTALYNNLPNASKASKTLTRKRISAVNHSKDTVIVECTDGSKYEGDIVVGADGVRSKIRSEMWRASNETDGKIPGSEQKPLYATFGCLFGISRPIKDFHPRHFDVIPDRDHSIMWAVGDDKIFWYVCYTLPKPLAAGEVRFSDADAEALAISLAECPVMPNGSHRFKELWDSRTTAVLLPTEMGEYKHCAWGRFAMLGDAVHKQTISAGQGGNLCMESAAALTNAIKRLVDENKVQRPSFDSIQSALVEDYQDPRAARVSSYVEKVNGHTALICKYNFPLRILQEYILPYLPREVGGSFFGDLEVGLDMLDFVPPPTAALSGTMPLNKLVGAGRRESILQRAKRASPLLLFFLLAIVKMDPSKANAELETMLRNNKIVWDTGSQSGFVTFYGIKPVDHLINVIITFCAGWTLGFDEEASWQVFTFFVDYGTLYVILLIESYRCANIFSLARLVMVWGLLCQLLGIGYVGQLYYFFHYLGSQMDNYKSLDMRTTDLQYTRSIVPAMMTFYVPLFMSLAAPLSVSSRYWWSWIWQPFPIWVAIVQYAMAKLQLYKNTLVYDRMSALDRDMPAIRLAVGFCATISSLVWLYTISQAPFSIWRGFSPKWDTPSGIWACARDFIAWDHVLASAGTFVWLALLFKDLKSWSKTDVGWVRLCSSAAASCIALGPGATAALGWLWREELLADRKMKGAVLEGSWQESTEELSAKVDGHATQW